MDINSISFQSHDSCEALTSSIRNLTSSMRLEKRKVLGTGEFLWTASDRPRQVFILQEGRIEISEADRAGKSSVTQVVRPGELFGYLCFCDHRFEPHGTEARATVRSAVLRTDYEEFRARLKRSQLAVTGLTEALCNRVAEVERRGRVLAIHDAQARLGTLLCQLAREKQGQRTADLGRVAVHVTHSELAARAALTRPHTTVLMNRLRRLGCVSYERGSAITVHLKKLAMLVA